MESTRQLKYAKLIQKELSEIFQRDTKSLFGNAFITITVVRMSPDLGLAKVFLSIMMADKEQMLAKLNAEKKQIRKMLGEKIRKQARVIPELAFFIDDNLEYANKMDTIFSKITIPKPDDKNENK